MNGFLTDDESRLGQQFLTDGHVILPVEDRDGLERIRALVTDIAARHLCQPAPGDAGAFLNGFSESVSIDALNDVRLAVINGMNEAEWLRPTYFSLARNALSVLVGNELAMQRRINLSIQLPRDDSSLLPVHADVWSGDSPFEVVVWLPLVDCRATKSMYLVPPSVNTQVQSRMAELKDQSAEDLFELISDDAVFLDVSYGDVVVFSQNLMHGNRVNEENETRWTMNCRFKSVFSPYADKKLGEFFEPVTLRPASRLGMEYRLPGGFDG